MVKVEIDYQLVEARGDGVAHTLSKTQWNLYVALWEAKGAYVSATLLASKLNISLESIRWHISYLRRQIGKEAVVTHARRWHGWRVNIPLAGSTLDFDYR